MEVHDHASSRSQSADVIIVGAGMAGLCGERKVRSWGDKHPYYAGEIPWLSPLAVGELILLRSRLTRMAAQIPPDRPWAATRAAAWDRMTLETWERRHLHRQ